MPPVGPAKWTRMKYTMASTTGMPTPSPTPAPMAMLLLPEEEEEEEEEVPPTTVRVGDGVSVAEGVGDTAGATTVASTAVAALMREVGESKPRELDTPACCTARIKEPSASLLLTRASKEDWVAASWREEEGVVKENCHPAWAPVESV